MNILPSLSSPSAPRPGAPTPAKKAEQPPQKREQVMLERLNHGLDTVAAVQAECDVSLKGSDAIHRAIDQARVPLRAVAEEKAADPAAAWQDAQKQVATLGTLAAALGNKVANRELRMLDNASQDLMHAAYLPENYDDKQVKKAANRVLDSAHTMAERYQPVTKMATEFAIAVAQATADMGAPVSKAQAALVLRNMEWAKIKLEQAEKETDQLHIGLYRTRMHGSNYKAELERVLAGKPVDRPTSYDQELHTLLDTIKVVPGATRQVMASYQTPAGFALEAHKARRRLADALRGADWQDPAKHDELRKQAGAALNDMKAALTKIQETLLPNGLRSTADNMVPAWYTLQQPLERLPKLDKELANAHERHHWLFFGGQYGKVEKALKPGLEPLRRGGELTEAAVKDGCTYGRNLIKLHRLVDDSARWLQLDPAVGLAPMRSNLDSMDRELTHVLYSLPPSDVPIEKAECLLQNVAGYVEKGARSVEAAAVMAHRKRI